MTFLYPIGLLGLIGIPVLIIIYIIKSKYTEQTIASTYLWRLSERFLKRHKKVNPVAGIISLILQILSIITLALLVAHPVITLEGAANEYCFILDGSGSMSMVQDGSTRYELAKDRIEEIIDDAVDGSAFSLICVDQNAELVFERLEDKDLAKNLLSEVTSAHCGASYSNALSTAQRIFENNPSVKVYLATDTSVETHNNIEVLNVAKSTSNFGVRDVTYTLTDTSLKVTGTLYAHGEGKDIPVQLLVNEETTPSSSTTIYVADGEEKSFELIATVDNLVNLTVVLPLEDALALDNQCVVNNLASEQAYKTLLVSKQPVFLKSISSATSGAQVEVVDPDEYTEASGYGLYIFDCFTPDTLPLDGAIWLIGTSSSVQGSGFNFRSHMELEEGGLLVNAGDTSVTATSLMEGLMGDKIYIKKYNKYSLYGNFAKLFTYDNNDVVFAGTNTYGSRQVVFAFDLHDSNLVYQHDFVPLMKNILKFSFPDIIESSVFTCGEEIKVNVLANCDSIRVESPSGETTYLTTDYATALYTLTESGEYKLILHIANTEREIRFYSIMGEEESNPVQNLSVLSVEGNATNDGYDGTFDPTVILFIFLAVIFFADWGLYCYEKHQLR